MLSLHISCRKIPSSVRYTGSTQLKISQVHTAEKSYPGLAWAAFRNLHNVAHPHANFPKHPPLAGLRLVEIVDHSTLV